MLQKTKYSCTLLIAFLFVIPSLASPLQALSHLSPALPQLLPSSNLTSLSELNASSTANADLKIQCSGQHFGVNPNIADCQSAMGYLSPDFVQYTWGLRHTGLGEDVIPLPYRIMGDRALCFFQATLIRDEARTAKASLGQLRRAASALILQCAANAESQGGLATNIGGDNNLALSLGIFNPTVQCRGGFGRELSSCGDILGDMPANGNRWVFGPRGLPGVQQGLPVSIISLDDKCVAKIFSTGNTDVSTWYRIWEAVTAVFSVCVRAGKGGVSTGIGDSGNIFLTVSSLVAAAGMELPSLPANGSMDTTE